jgi:hypothetical protein
MKRKISITLCFTAALAAILFSAAFAIAEDSSTNCAPDELGGFWNFIDYSEYFNEDPEGRRCIAISEFDFENLYYVAAIAKEAGFINSVQYNETTLFSTSGCSIWGLYALIDFNQAIGLKFVSRNNGTTANYNLDPFNSTNPHKARFTVCQLTEDSDPLGYLSYPTKLLKGDLIVGFEDSSDNDFNDLIVALRALNTKENPRFSIQKDISENNFDGEGFCFEWTDNLTCKAVVKGCSCEETCDNLTGEPLGDIFLNNLDPAVFFGTEGGACKPVYIKFENGDRCAVIGDRVYCKSLSQND